MAQIIINVDGKEYPCRPTMGALLRFKRETGREVSNMDGSIEDLCTFLWCCVCSAAKREGMKFDMSLMDFADQLETDVIENWLKQNQGMLDDNNQEQQKKT